ncbi:MAG: hypothetical protein QOJ81_570 [Chloroflexota bacterium]|jgi:hypothetical protein|nr:hypothetical protein [Chloroflexota bacterium]
MRPLSLVAALLLIVGVTLTGLNLLLWGWTVYAAGHVAAIGALIAIAAVNRARLDVFAWLGLIVLVAGLVLALPQVVAIWQSYATESPAVLACAGCQGPRQPMEVPSLTAPVGLAAELVTWIGVAFFGLAARGAHALPRGIGWVMAGAAVIGIIAALNIVSPYAWVAAMLLLALSLLAIGASAKRSA